MRWPHQSWGTHRCGETNNIYIQSWTPSVPPKILGDRNVLWRPGYEYKRIVASGGGVNISVVCRVEREESFLRGKLSHYNMKQILGNIILWKERTAVPLLRSYSLD